MSPVTKNIGKWSEKSLSCIPDKCCLRYLFVIVLLIRVALLAPYLVGWVIIGNTKLVNRASRKLLVYDQYMS